MYRLSNEIIERLSSIDESAREKITDCLTLWAWMSDVNNSSPKPPFADTEENRALSERLFNIGELIYLPEDLRVVGVYELGKAHRRFDKEKLLDRLKVLSGVVVSAVFTDISTGGRPKEIIYMVPHWLATDNELAFSKLESELCDLLMLTLPTEQAETIAQPKKPTEPTAPKQPEALRILADMWVSMNGLTGFSLKAGSIINSADNYSVFSWLLSSGAPVAPVDDKLAAVCTSCKARFDLDESLSVGAEAVIFFRDSYFPYNNVTVCRSGGALESDFHLCRYALGKNLARWCNSEEIAVCPRCSAVMLRSELGLGGLSAQQYAAVNKPVQRIDQESAQPVSSAPVVSGTCGVSSKSTSQSDKQFKPYADPIRQAHDDDNMNKWLDKRFPG